MGAADIVPGVSGGTVALVLGIYEHLLGAIRDVVRAVLTGLRGDVAGARRGLAAVRWGFIAPLLGGILAAIVVGAFTLVPLLDRFPVQMKALFFGLVLASLAVPARRIRRRTRLLAVLGIVAAVLAFWLVGFTSAPGGEPGLLRIFGSAAVAICAMILPGVSGSYLLVALGMYEVTTEAIKGFDLGYIAIFGLGAALGLAVFSKLLTVLLERRHDETMAVLVGLMVGSLRALWPWLDTETRALVPVGGIGEVLGVVLLGLLGFAVVTALLVVGGRAARRQSLTPEPASA